MDFSVYKGGKEIKRIPLETTAAYARKRDSLLAETRANGVLLPRHHQKGDTTKECRGSGKEPSRVDLALLGQGIVIEILNGELEDVRVRDVGRGLLRTTCSRCRGNFYFDNDSCKWYRG